jgi:hypothetical protein
MNNVTQPSKATLQKAWELGREMARRERRLMPVLSGAHEYPTYLRFIAAHRCRLEHTRVFEPWDAQLHKMIEVEGRRARLDLNNPQQWETLYAQLGTPIRCAFWYGWEQSFRLQKLYDQQMELARRAAEKPKVLRVYNPPQSPMIPSSPIIDRMSDNDRWDTIADKLFDGMQGDSSEAFWDTPAAETTAQKSKADGEQDR